MGKTKSRKLICKCFVVLGFFILILVGFFAVTKVFQLRHAALQSVILAYSVYFSACLYSYLGYRYFKYVRNEKYDKKTFVAIGLGFFILGAVFTYVVVNLLSQVLTIVFAFIFSIDTHINSLNEEYASIFTYFIGAVSCAIALIGYHLAAGKYAVTPKANSERKEE